VLLSLEEEKNENGQAYVDFSFGVACSVIVLYIAGTGKDGLLVG
jgi:hypothetical protein